MNETAISQIIKIFSLVLPTLFSGLALIVVLKLHLLSFLNKPVDFGLSFRGIRVFGDNKTYRGVVVFITTSILTSYILYFIYKTGGNSFIHPVFGHTVSTGLIYSVSYVCGELVNSAVKRRLHIKPGSIIGNFRHIQTFFDLSDGIIFTAIILTLLTVVKAEEAILACVIGIFIHFLIDKLMQNLHLKKQV